MLLLLRPQLPQQIAMSGKKCGLQPLWKKGHFAKVCMSKQTSTQSATASVTDRPIASTIGATGCLDHAVVNVLVQNTTARALVDSEASNSYLNEYLADEINFS